MLNRPQLIPTSSWLDPSITLLDAEIPITFTLQEVFHYHGYDAVGGVVLGFRLLQKCIRLLQADNLQLLSRRDFHLFTAFPGLGARDCFEFITRMASEQRMQVDTRYDYPGVQAGITGSFYFEFHYHGQSIKLAPIVGYPTAQFLALGHASKQTAPSDEIRQGWQAAKYTLANTLLQADCDAVIRRLDH